jgi:ABC-type transport system involved in multi-copper enzyme maturation permease subunit
MAGVQAGLLLAGQSYNVLDTLPHLVNALLVAFNYGMVGFMIAAVSGQRGWALGAASGLAFASYLVNTMSVSVSSLATADKLTLFHYYSTTGSYDWHNLLIQVAVALLLVAVSVIGFNRRDIRAH